MDQAFLLPALIWAILTILFLTDKSLSFIFRILISIILIFNFYLWWDELYMAFNLLVKTKGGNIQKLLKESFQLALLSLFWIWPTILGSAMLFIGPGYRNSAILTGILFSLVSITGHVLLNLF